MIRYTLKCEAEHSFESWFQSASAYEALKAAGHVTCAVCGSTSVEKAIMAPRVTAARDKARPLSKPQNKTEAQLAAMRKQVEENATYVGGSFAKEARAMYEDGVPERSIWGEAKPEEAKAQIEDGIPVAPLPIIPNRKAN